MLGSVTLQFQEQARAFGEAEAERLKLAVARKVSSMLNERRDQLRSSLGGALRDGRPWETTVRHASESLLQDLTRGCKRQRSPSPRRADPNVLAPPSGDGARPRQSRTKPKAC